MWRYYLSKVINFLKFIGILAFVFLIGHNVYAQTVLTYYQNFDGVNVGTCINPNNLTNWHTDLGGTNQYGTTCASTTANHYFINPASMITAPTNNYYQDTNNSFITTSFWFFVNSSSWASGTIDKIQLENTSFNQLINVLFAHDTVENYGDVYLSANGGYFSLFPQNSVNNQWHRIIIYLNPNTNAIAVATDTSSIYGVKYTGLIYSGGVINTINLQQNASNAPIYLDDLSINNATNVALDNITLIQPMTPVDLTTYYVNTFAWKYNFNVSQASYNTYQTYTILINYNASTSNPSLANTSKILDYYDKSQLLPNITTQTFTNNSSTNVPSQIGDYQGSLELMGDTTALAYSPFNFYIGTTTPSTNNAWCGNVCTNEATTSDFFTGFKNGFICGGQLILCFALYPDNFTLGVLNSAYTDFQQSFPFNVWFQLASTTQAVFSTTTSQNATFGMPMINKTGNLYILPVLSSSSVGNLIGKTNSSNFRTDLSYIIYAIYACGIILILW